MRQLNRELNREGITEEASMKQYSTQITGGPKKVYNKRRRLDPRSSRINDPEPVLEVKWFKELCGVLAYKRRQRGISQLQLADLVKTTQGAISRLECGKANPTAEFLDRVCVALRLNLSFIITDLDKK